MSSDRRETLRAAAERRSKTEERRSLRRSAGLSVLFHVSIFAALFLIPFSGEWLEDPPLTVTLVLAEPGAAGAAGGTGQGKGGGTVAPKDAEDARVAGAPPPSPQPPAEAAPEPTPPEPIPPVAERVPPQVAELPPSPDGLAPPKPESKPAPPAPRAKPKPPAKAAPPRPRDLPPAPVATAPPGPQVADAAGALPGTGPRGAAGEGPGGPLAGNGRGVSGSGRGAIGGGPSDAIGDEWLERVRRWMAKYKRFPPEADKREDKGVVTLAIVLRRDGVVLDAQVERSSGSRLLDDAAVDMARRSSPVPPAPPMLTGDQFEFLIPVDFKRGFFLRNIFGGD
jgi:periplasmic protein TonB